MAAEQIWTIEALYLRQPSPEYRQAFNLAVAGCQDREEPLLAVTSSAAHAVELLKRCRKPLHFVSTGSFDAVQFASEASDWAWGPIEPASYASEAQRYTAIVWAEPEAASAEQAVRTINHLAEPGASLRVIASAPLHRFLPEWLAGPRLAEKPLAAGPVESLLSALSWRIDQKTVFHGPCSIWWSYLARGAEKIGRSDWADRCLFAMRQAYLEPGWLWRFAPLALIQARIG